MFDDPMLHLDIVPHEVQLHYPGAEGVTFQDALLTIRNLAERPTESLELQLRLEQEGKELYAGTTSLASLGLREPLTGGKEASLSLFRALQREVSGFASRVNMFGYKAALDWTFLVEARVRDASEPAHRSRRQSWTVRWSVDPNDEKKALLHVQ